MEQSQTISSQSVDSFDPCDHVPRTQGFRGRNSELEQLTQWALNPDVRLISIQGLGGIGKTQLAAKLYQNLGLNFDRRVWQPLNHDETLVECLSDLMGRFAPSSDLMTSERSIRKLLQVLQSQRILIVLDEKLSLSGDRAFEFEPLFKELVSQPHQSCVVLTTQIRSDLTSIGNRETIKTCLLNGLDRNAVKELLCDRGLEFDLEELRQLNARHRGHPLALKLVASIVRDTCQGKIAQYLSGDAVLVPDRIATILDRVISPLGKAEKMILKHLAADSPMRSSAAVLQSELGISLADCLGAIKRLEDRSLLEHESEDRHYLLTLQPMVMQFVRQHL